MRKTSVRRFIHAVLDVLPLLIIPIFALNILHKETEPISITIGGYEYQNKYNTNEVTNYKNDLIEGNIYKLTYENFFTTTGGYVVYASDIYNFGMYTDVNTSSETSTFLVIEIRNNGIYIRDNNYSPVITNYNMTLPFSFDFVYYGQPISDYSTYVTISDTTFNIEEKVYNPEIVYNSTDIGSQFVYALYKPVNDYFNFNNLFNMGAIYNWIELNLFSGTAPLPIFIIWNVIVYEFFIDLIFLMYSLFMFVIDWSTNMIDKFLYKSRS